MPGAGTVVGEHGRRELRVGHVDLRAYNSALALAAFLIAAACCAAVALLKATNARDVPGHGESIT